MISRSLHGAKNLPLSTTTVPYLDYKLGETDYIDADIPLKQRATAKKTISRRVDGLVDREVDAAGTPKPNPKSVVNKAEYSELASKKKRIVVSDDESDDDAPLVPPTPYLKALECTDLRLDILR